MTTYITRDDIRSAQAEGVVDGTLQAAACSDADERGHSRPDRYVHIASRPHLLRRVLDPEARESLTDALSHDDDDATDDLMSLWDAYSSAYERTVDRNVK